MENGIRFEVTGGNGRGASLDAIKGALRQAGARNVRQAHAFGWSNQPRVATFTAQDDSEARKVCDAACEILWPGDGSIMANLIAYEKGKAYKNA